MHMLSDLIQQAKQKALEADEAQARAAEALKSSLENLLPAGTVFNMNDRRDKGFPEYLRSVHTIGGKDHSSKIFRIEEITQVLFDPRNPELATWEANATAISEKTGKDLNASVAHSANNHGTFVRIAGSLSVTTSPDESIEAQLERMIRTFDNLPQSH